LNGVNVSTPVMNPIASLTRGQGRNEPCAQSCMMTNVRMSSPASGTINSAVAQGARDISQYPSTSPPTSSVSVTNTCQSEAVVSGPV
jgi:hypothetical protein